MKRHYSKNKYFIYSFFVVYILFSPVCPFVHVHTHQVEKKSKRDLGFHPSGVECPIEHEGCEHHHKQHDHHYHRVRDLNHIQLAETNIFCRVVLKARNLELKHTTCR